MAGRMIQLGERQIPAGHKWPQGPYSHYSVHVARTPKSCGECGAAIGKGGPYFRKISPSGYEVVICPDHVDLGRQDEFERRWEEAERTSYVQIETDASGSGSGRWAFVAYRVREGQKVLLDFGRGEMEGQGYATPAEGAAVIKGAEWLIQAEEAGTVRQNEMVCISNDNVAVLTKMHTGSCKGDYQQLWTRMAELLRPLRENGRLVVAGPNDTADFLVSGVGARLTEDDIRARLEQ